MHGPHHYWRPVGINETWNEGGELPLAFARENRNLRNPGPFVPHRNADRVTGPHSNPFNENGVHHLGP